MFYHQDERDAAAEVGGIVLTIVAITLAALLVFVSLV